MRLRDQIRQQQKVAYLQSKLAEIDAFLLPEKQAERRKNRNVECTRERRKYRRLWA